MNKLNNVVMSEQIKTVDNYIQNLQKTINSLKTINGELVNENARLRGQNKALRVNINKHHDELNKLKVYNHQLNEKIKERKNNLQVSSNLNLKQMNEAIDTIKEQLKNGIFVDYTTYSEIINNLSHAISEGVIEKSIYDKLISMVSNK